MGGTVIWYSEVNSVNTANLVRTYVGQGATMSALGDCYANNTGSSILVGDFGDARLMKYGNDACNPKSWSGVNFNLIEPLSFSPTNQNIVGFKSKTSEFYWFGDGGMTFYSGGVPPVSGNRYPWLLDGGQRPVIGTWNNQTNISNSVMMMNIIVKAMKAAQ